MVFKKFFNKDSSLAETYAKEFNVLPSTMYLILSRGIVNREDISNYLSVGQLLDPFLINNMKQLCERIHLAKQMGDKVLIFGDYDVDGVSATAIMLKTLKKIGIDADFYLPNRYVYIVYTNAIGKQKPLKHTKPLGCPVDELFEIANNCRAFISIRSGVADFLVDTKCFMILTYVKEPHFRFTHTLKDLGKNNIEECFCKNEKDIQSLKNIVVENIIEKDKL